MQYNQFFATRVDTGMVLPYATVTVYLTGTQTLASLFNATGGAIGNPVTATATGLVGFEVADGTYDAVVKSADGLYTSPTLSSLQIYDLAAMKASIGSSAPLFTSTVNGLVPASGGGTVNFLRADGTFVAPPGSTTFTSTVAGIVPASGGGTVNFLRADGTFAVPPGGTTYSTFTAGTAGLVPASGGGTVNFLRADGTFAAPPSPNVTGLPTVATRTALANISSPAAGASYYLAEAGREGVFVFSTANLSTYVTADTQQGMYVPPAAATTGASGAWVRKISGKYDLRWFGGVSDCTGFGVGTDNAPAINGLIATSNATGLRQMLVPAGRWRVASRISLTQGIQIYGEGWHENPGIAGGVSYAGIYSMDGTLFVVDQNVGFLLGNSYSDNTNASAALASLNANGISSAEYKYKSASGTVLKDFMVWSAGGTDATKHGIEFRTGVIAENVRTQGFPGNGWQLDADTGGNGATTPFGIMDGASFYRCHATTNLGHGFFVRGNDANTLTFLGCSSRYNGGAGYCDVSQLGNSYYLCHAASNNQSAGTFGQTINSITFSGTTATVTTAAAHGRATGDKINVSNAVPTTYNVDNTAITVTGTTTFTYTLGGTPASNATTVGVYLYGPTANRATMTADAPFLKDAYSGSYYTNSQVGAHTYTGCYTESGQGLKYSLEIGCVVIGGNLASPNSSSVGSNLKTNINGGGTITATGLTSADSAGAGTLTMTASQMNLSQPTGSVIFRINPVGGTYSNIQMYGTGASANGLDILAGSGASYFSAGGFLFRNAAQTTNWANIDGTGIRSLLGGIGYATGAGGTVTQATSKTTGVTLNKVCGQITLNAASLAANTAVSFTFTNSNITPTDVMRLNVASGSATPGSYLVQAEGFGSGSVTISLRNLTAGALAEALVLNYVIVKSVAS